MKEEVLRIMRLVEQGKIKPEDAAELIEALSDSPGVTAENEREQERVGAASSTYTAGGRAEANANGGATSSQSETNHDPNTGNANPQTPKDAFGSILDSFEQATRSTIEKIDLKKIAEEVKTQTKRSVDEVQKALEHFQKGEFWAKVSVRTGSVENKHQELNFQIEPGKKLRIENPLGDTIVTGGADFAQVIADAEIRGLTKEQAEERSRSWSVMIEETPEGSILRVPQIDGSPATSADVNVRIPNGVAVEVRSTNGDVTVIDTYAPVDIDTMKGDVKVRNAKGNVRLYLTSGDISLEDTVGERVHIETQTGDINAHHVSGNISAKTHSGDINLSEVTGTRLNLETLNGDTNLDLSAPFTEVLIIRSVNGDINIVTPDGGNFKISLAAVSGDVNCSLPASQISRGERHWSGVQGDGSGTFEVNSVRGDINVALKDARTS